MIKMHDDRRRLYEFGQFRLDADDRILHHGDSPVSLSPKTVEVLLALVERAGHVVSKDELMEKVWADSFVEDSNLTQSIFVLRKALGETNKGREFIETVPRRGYRFVCPVRTASEANFNASDSDASNGVPVRSQPTREPQTFRQKWKSFFAPIGVFAVFLVVVGLATNNFYRSKNQNDTASASAASAGRTEIRRLTADSRVYSPAVSPDGKLLAYKRVEENTESVWLKDIATGSDIQIRPPSDEGYSGLVFSPDATELYYRVEKTLPDVVKRGVIVRAPVFGGVERKVAEQPWTNFALSPDGKHLAFVRSLGKPESDRILVVVDTDTGDERALAKSDPGEFMFRLWGTSPSWSSDGGRILVCGTKRDGGVDHGALFEVTLSDGAVSEVPSPGWHEAFQAVWLADGTGMLVVAREARNTPFQIWRLSFPSGEAERVTNDLHSYGTISFAPLTNTLVAQQEIRNSHIWVMPDAETDHARQWTTGTNAIDGTHGLAWMPDGRLIFSSNRGGEFDLWTVDADGSDLRQLTANSGANQFPRVSDDGRYIVFVSNRAGRSNIWRMDANGTSVVQLTNGAGEMWPSISPDGGWVYYSNVATPPGTIERVSIDGGEILKVPNEPFGGGAPVMSPDGKLLAYYVFTETTGWRTGILPTEGGKTIKFLELQGSRGFEEWTPDSQSLIYIKPGFLSSNLWRESLDGKRTDQITYFDDGHISYFAFSPDRKQIALARGNNFSDIVLIENFR